MDCIKLNIFNRYIVKLSFNKIRQRFFLKEHRLTKLLYDRKTYFNENYPFIFIQEYIKGKTLNQFKLGFYYNLIKYIKELRRLHLGWSDLSPCYFWKDFLSKDLQKDICYCIKHKIFYKPLEVDVLLNKSIKKINRISSCLLHGDPSGENVIFDGNSCYLIDLEHSIVGDYIYDLAFLSTFYPSYNELIVEVYGKGDKNFWFKFWTYYLRISVMKIVILHKKGYNNLTKAENRIYIAIQELEKLKYV